MAKEPFALRGFARGGSRGQGQGELGLSSFFGWAGEK
jgi:hypothetical protein